MNRKQLFKKDYAPELLRIAESDLEAASLLLGTGKARAETVIFHVQQCIEKSIKSVICHCEIPVLLVHDIGSLLGCLPDSILPDEGYSLTRFNDYAGILRYEEGRAVLTDDDTLAAIEVGRSVLSWAKRHITPS